MRAVPHRDHRGLAHPGETAVKEDELGARVCLDQVHQEHRVGSLDPGIPGVNLKRQIVPGTQLDQPPHDEILEVVNLVGSHCSEDGSRP